MEGASKTSIIERQLEQVNIGKSLLYVFRKYATNFRSRIEKNTKKPKQPKNNNKQKQEQKKQTRQMSKFNFNNAENTKQLFFLLNVNKV